MDMAVMVYKIGTDPLGWLATRTATPLFERYLGEKATLPEMRFGSPASEFIVRTSPMDTFVRYLGMTVRSYSPGGKMYEQEIAKTKKTNGKDWVKSIGFWCGSFLPKPLMK
jgi:hypothetical protein